MLKRFLVYGILALVLIALFVYQGRLSPGAGVGLGPASSPATVRRAAARNPGDLYRLRPDTRVLLALSAVERALGNAHADSVSAEWSDGRWRIRADARAVGSLGEYPAFDECFALVRDWARQLDAAGRVRRGEGPPDAELEQSLARLEALRALVRADAAWARGERSEGVAARAGHAALWLALETTDRVGASDETVARALALLALRAALDDSTAIAERALLAYRMGYEASAVRLAQGLSEADPCRMFIERRDDELAAAARSKSATDETRFLRLLRLAALHDPEGWGDGANRWFASRPGMALPLWCSALQLGRFGTHLPVAAMVLEKVSESLRLDLEGTAVAAGGGDAPLGGLLDAFERLLERMPASADGPLADRALLASYYRSCFYSSILHIGDHVRVSLSSIPATRDFAASIAAAETPVAREFAEWFGHLSEFKQGHLDRSLLNRDIGAIRSFRGPLQARSYQALVESGATGDLMLRVSTRRLARALDARPGYRMVLGWDVHAYAWDLVTAETLLEAARAEAHPRDVHAKSWAAAYHGDRDALFVLAGRADLSGDDLVAVLEAVLESRSIETERIGALFDRAVAAHPHHRELVARAARYFQAQGQLEKARALLEAWLATSTPPADPFDELFVRSQLSRVCRRLGKPDEALNAVDEAAGSWQFGTMAEKCRALASLGRMPEAQELAAQAWKRYPDSDAAQLLAIELLWREGRYEDAASLARRAPRPMAPATWQGRAVLALEEAVPDSAGRERAVRAMLMHGPDPLLAAREMALTLSRGGEHAIAFDVLSRIQTPGDQGKYETLLAYGVLKRWKGEVAALEWLKPRLEASSDRDRAFWEMTAYTQGFDELLWIVPMPRAPDDADFAWLLRAAAAVRSKDADPTRRAELERWHARGGGTYYRDIGRYLLGRLPEAEVEATMTGPKRTCEWAYYRGLKAEAEGRIRDAAESYTRCLDTNQTMNGECGWARQRLIVWSGEYKSFERLAREGATEVTFAQLLER